MLLADPHALLRAGPRAALKAESDLEVVGEASDGHEAVRAAAALQPDVVVLEVRLPGLDGIAATRSITSMGAVPAPRVLVLSSSDVEDDLLAAVRAGASGYLVKEADAREVVVAVRQVAAGEGALSSSAARLLIAYEARRPPPAPAPSREVAARLARLTPRERELLQHLAAGRSDRGIAAAMALTPATVKTYVHRILHKLEAGTRVRAVVLAFHGGLVPPPADDRCGAGDECTSTARFTDGTHEQ